jgi:hypothetical protein
VATAQLSRQRYESTADLADLAAALALSRQLRDEPTLDPELRTGVLENLRGQRWIKAADLRAAKGE